MPLIVEIQTMMDLEILEPVKIGIKVAPMSAKLCTSHYRR